jgi:hypothetical protein
MSELQDVIMPPGMQKSPMGQCALTDSGVEM